MYFLDTNICIYYLKGMFPQLRDRLLQTSPAKLFIPSTVEAELWFGLEKVGAKEPARETLRTFLAQFQILPFDSQAAMHYARVRGILEKEGKPIGPNDLFIAATVLTHGGTLVTRNTSEFSRVPGLAVEDWTT